MYIWANSEEKSKMKVNFLDVVQKTGNGRLSAVLYSKPVDTRLWTYKKFIIYSQTLRLRKIYLERKDLKSHGEDFKRWFLRRSCCQRIMESKCMGYLKFLQNMIPSKSKRKIVFRYFLLLTIPHLRIYLRFWAKSLYSLTQIQRSEQFLHHVHLLPIELLKILRLFLWGLESVY